jgi:hypothetical protein
MQPTIGICAIIKDEGCYLKEWLSFHALMGVSAFVLYDNDSTDAPDEIVSRLGHFPPVTLKRWPNQLLWRETQRRAYLDGADHFANRVSFVAFIDADEFLFSPFGDSLPAVLARHSDSIGAIAVCQSVFGSSSEISYDPRPVIARFTRRAADDHIEHKWFKSIARPERIADFDSSHSVILRDGMYVYSEGSTLTRSEVYPGMAERSIRGPLVLNHYILKSLEEFKHKQSRWKGSSLESRYCESYFRERDSFANAQLDDYLVHFTPQMEILCR